MIRMTNREDINAPYISLRFFFTILGGKLSPQNGEHSFVITKIKHFTFDGALFI
jgi:hypothetical protein